MNAAKVIGAFVCIMAVSVIYDFLTLKIAGWWRTRRKLHRVTLRSIIVGGELHGREEIFEMQDYETIMFRGYGGKPVLRVIIEEGQGITLQLFRPGATDAILEEFDTKQHSAH